MESLVAGTLAGTGSFRCEQCGYMLTLLQEDQVPSCPSCGGDRFDRASLFAAGEILASSAEPAEPADTPALLADAADDLQEPGLYLVYREGDAVRVATLEREWTRIGRSLAADIRFDDPTVSRRHALIVRQADGVRVLDDRSLNGVFVNGERVEWRALTDGDEIAVGRYHLHFVAVAGVGQDTGTMPRVDAAPSSLETEA